MIQQMYYIPDEAIFLSASSSIYSAWVWGPLKAFKKFSSFTNHVYQAFYLTLAVKYKSTQWYIVSLTVWFPSLQKFIDNDI